MRCEGEDAGEKGYGSERLARGFVAVHQNRADWAQIIALYDLLLQMEPSPVIRLNRAVAAAMRDGPAAGLALIQDLNKEGELAGYQWLYFAQADLHRRLEQAPEAQAAYQKALSMSQQEPERRYLERRLQELEKNSLDVCRIWGAAKRLRVQDQN